ncbi:hypothetical protein HK096_008608, partial [Nowakowskiella sp. JEL0078]
FFSSGTVVTPFHVSLFVGDLKFSPQSAPCTITNNIGQSLSPIWSASLASNAGPLSNVTGTDNLYYIEIKLEESDVKGKGDTFFWQIYPRGNSANICSVGPLSEPESISFGFSTSLSSLSSLSTTAPTSTSSQIIDHSSTGIAVQSSQVLCNVDCFKITLSIALVVSFIILLVILIYCLRLRRARLVKAALSTSSKGCVSSSSQWIVTDRNSIFATEERHSPLSSPAIETSTGELKSIITVQRQMLSLIPDYDSPAEKDLEKVTAPPEDNAETEITEIETKVDTPIESVQQLPKISIEANGHLDRESWAVSESSDGSNKFSTTEAKLIAETFRKGLMNPLRAKDWQDNETPKKSGFDSEVVVSMNRHLTKSKESVWTSGTFEYDEENIVGMYESNEGVEAEANDFKRSKPKRYSVVSSGSIGLSKFGRRNFENA